MRARPARSRRCPRAGSTRFQPPARRREAGRSRSGWSYALTAGRGDPGGAGPLRLTLPADIPCPSSRRRKGRQADVRAHRADDETSHSSPGATPARGGQWGRQDRTACRAVDPRLFYYSDDERGPTRATREARRRPSAAVSRSVRLRPGRKLVHVRRPLVVPRSGRPTHRSALRRLGRLGIHAQPGRRAALLQLAADVPAAVLADLLGIAVTTAADWADGFQGDGVPGVIAPGTALRRPVC
jgi:hypothetical protein